MNVVRQIQVIHNCLFNRINKAVIGPEYDVTCNPFWLQAYIPIVQGRASSLHESTLSELLAQSNDDNHLK